MVVIGDGYTIALFYYLAAIRLDFRGKFERIGMNNQPIEKFDFALFF